MAVSVALAAPALGCSSSGGGGGGGSGGGGGGAGGPATPTSVIDIRADVNRNGTIDLADPTEDELEADWTDKAGAVFLANIDDDEDVCPYDETMADAQLAQCFDGADDHVNGEADLIDMARIRTLPWPEAPADATGTLSVLSPAGADPWQFVRVFRNNAGSWELLPPDYPLTQAELQSGVELAIEAKDIVRDRAVWDGFVDVKLTVDMTATGDRIPTARTWCGCAWRRCSSCTTYRWPRKST
jgi:protein-arginine deiminase